YVSTGPDPRATEWDFVGSFDQSDLASTIDDHEFGRYQNLHFVADRTGRLFLIGTNRNWLGHDWVDGFLVTGTGDRPGGPIALTKVARRHLDCDVDGVGQCDLKAGAGTFVDRDGVLLLYAVELA